MNKIYWAKVKEQAIIPTKREEDAGYDLYPCFEEDYIEIVPFFRPGSCEIREFENPQYFDRDSFIGRNLSSSYAPVAGSRQREKFVDALTDLFDRWKNAEGRIAVHHVTRRYFGRV